MRRASDLAHYRPVPSEDLARAAARLDAATVAAERARLRGSPEPEPDGARPLLVHVGRWSAEKRLQLLVNCARGQDLFTLVIVGDAADDKVAEDVERWHARRASS